MLSLSFILQQFYLCFFFAFTFSLEQGDKGEPSMKVGMENYFMSV